MPLGRFLAGWTSLSVQPTTLSKLVLKNTYTTFEYPVGTGMLSLFGNGITHSNTTINSRWFSLSVSNGKDVNAIHNTLKAESPSLISSSTSESHISSSNNDDLSKTLLSMNKSGSSLSSISALNNNINNNDNSGLNLANNNNNSNIKSFKRKAVLTLTPRAVERLKVLHIRGLSFQNEENVDSKSSSLKRKYLKIGTQQKGCSGNSYKLDIVEGPSSKFDEIIKQDGVEVIIDSKALLTIIGSEMDYIEDDLRQEFIFNNPNVKDMCGCGQSFIV